MPGRTPKLNSRALMRTRLLLGDEAMPRLANAHVLICGVGGVGSWAAEALARSGIGRITLLDFDKVVSSNINRQAHASGKTLGRRKTNAMKERIQQLAIGNEVAAMNIHLTPESVGDILAAGDYDAVVDAIDERPAKLQLLQECVERKIPVVSSMGAASKLSSEGITSGCLFESIGCPLAKLVRKELRRRGITGGIRCVFSPAQPKETAGEPLVNRGERRPLGSLVTVTAAFGFRCAEEVINILIS